MYRSVDKTFWYRVAFYQLVMPFHEVLFGLDAGLPEHIQEELEELRSRWSNKSAGIWH